jgi:hypothetical protein
VQTDVTTEVVSDPVSEVTVEESTGEDPAAAGDASVPTNENTEIKPEQTESKDVDAVANTEQVVVATPETEMTEVTAPVDAEVSYHEPEYGTRHTSA